MVMTTLTVMIGESWCMMHKTHQLQGCVSIEASSASSARNGGTKVNRDLGVVGSCWEAVWVTRWD